MTARQALGIDLLKGDIRWTLVGGTLATPEYVKHGRVKYNSDIPRDRLANAFSSNFRELIAEHKPSWVGYRVNHRVNKVDQAAYLIMPFGILASICFNDQIRIIEYNNSSYTAKRFALPKGDDPAVAVSEFMGSPGPHWDNNQVNSAMSAWGCLNV